MNQVRRMNFAFAAVVGLGSPPPATSPSAPPLEEETEDVAVRDARDHFRRGVELFEDANFEAALFEFNIAYERAPNYRLFYNIAVAEMELNDYASAQTSFRRYLEEGGSEVNDRRREKVEAELAKLADWVGVIAVETEPPGMIVVVDGKEVGPSPVEVPANIGTRTVEASAEGYVNAREEVSVAGAEVSRVLLRLEPREAAATTSLVQPDRQQVQPVRGTTSAEQNERVKRLRLGTWISLGVAGAAGVGAVVTGVLALGARDDLEQEQTGETTRDELDDLSNRARTLGIVTDGLIAVGVVAVATAVGFGVASRRAQTHPKKNRSDTRARADRAPIWRAGAGGITLQF